MDDQANILPDTYLNGPVEILSKRYVLTWLWSIQVDDVT